ncbi:hypothetical protein [Micromonospora endophytica]|nr:hypothetical protein [Micromonospora endophytica]
MRDISPSVPDFTQWPSFPFEGELRVKPLDEPVPVEPPRKGEGDRECTACQAPDEAYIWVGERWRVRAMDRPTGLPMVLILESRSHLDLGDLPNLLAAELGVMTVRLERAIRSLDGVARVHVNRWGDGSAHLHMWFLARPYGRLQLRGTFLSLWDSILPPISEDKWRENLALVAAWLADFGGRPLAEPPRIQWQAPSSFAAPEPSAADAPQGGSLLDVMGETAVPPDVDGVALRESLLPVEDSSPDAQEADAPEADAPEVDAPEADAPEVDASEVNASAIEETSVATAEDSGAAAAVVPSPRRSPEGQAGAAESAVPVSGRQSSLAGEAAETGTATTEPEKAAAGGRAAAGLPAAGATSESDEQKAE